MDQQSESLSVLREIRDAIQKLADATKRMDDETRRYRDEIDRNQKVMIAQQKRNFKGMLFLAVVFGLFFGAILAGMLATKN